MSRAQIRTLPGNTAISSQAPLPASSLVSSPPGKRLRINKPSNAPKALPEVLLAEDDDHLRTLMQTALERASYHVVACSNGASALDAFLNSRSADLLISDLEMPHMTGDSLATEISRFDPSFPIILMSGSDLQPRMQSAINHAGWLFLPKPFGVPDMLNAIDLLLPQSARSHCR